MNVKDTLAMRALAERADLAEAKYEALCQAVATLLQEFVDGAPNAEIVRTLEVAEDRIADATELDRFCSNTEHCGAVMDPNADKCLECGQPRRVT